MRLFLTIILSLALSGCALLRHDSIAEGIFPDAEAYYGGELIDAEWAQ